MKTKEIVLVVNEPETGDRLPFTVCKVGDIALVYDTEGGLTVVNPEDPFDSKNGWHLITGLLGIEPEISRSVIAS